MIASKKTADHKDKKLHQLQKQGQEQASRALVISQQYQDSAKVLNCLLWGLLAALLAVLAGPVLYNMFAYGNGTPAEETVLRYALSCFGLFSFAVFFGNELGKPLNINTSVFSLFNKNREQLIELVKMGCTAGGIIGLSALIIDSISYNILYIFSDDMAANALSASSLLLSSMELWKRAAYAMYEGVIQELFGRFFLVLFVMHLLKLLIQKANAFATQQQKPQATSTLESLYHKLLLLVHGKFQTRTDLPQTDPLTVTSIVLSAIVYSVFKLKSAFGTVAFYETASTTFWLMSTLRATVLHTAVGVVFGYLFIVQEIECAMIAHAVSEFVQLLFL